MMKSITTGLLVTLGMIAGSVYASSYPTKAVRLIVPYSAGGVTDQIGRALANQMGKHLGQTVVVENKTGANGTMGAIEMLNARPDGYTITMVPIGIFRMPHLTGASYDPAKDLTYISQVAGYDYFVAVQADAPWQSAKDLVDYARVHPDSISYGTPGAYSSQHIAMVQLGEEAGVSWTHIPYKGDADALAAMLGGHIQVLVGASTVLPYVQDGKVRVLAALGAERSTSLPDRPTLKEEGYGVVHASPFGIAGPKNMPEDVVATLDGAIGETMKDPDFLALLQRVGVSPAYMDHPTYTAASLKNVDVERETIEGLSKLLQKE
ncbi:tripartite tricarboxylate transporter substrate binding protein [Alcaligenaceae bacterium]|nr:tripartite tricarboxylate transporter substrate binding protein [Alcaligenaceae bacterium]